MTLTSSQGLTLLSVPWCLEEELRRWRQAREVEIALRNKVGVSIVMDMLTPQALEVLVEVAKSDQHGQLVDLLNVAGEF